MIGFNMIAVQSLANLSAKKVTTSLLLLCFCILCFVWPIENSNLPANRNLFIYVGLAMTLFLYCKKQGMPLAHNAKSRMPIYILAGRGSTCAPGCCFSLAYSSTPLQPAAFEA